jgi:hypothetical protein
MPNFEEALDMGIDYAVDMAISQTGMPYCDQTCHDAVSGEIKDEVHQASTTSQPQPGCPKNGDGHLYAWDANGTKWNLSPLCFPPGVQTTPAPGSMYENGAVMIKVTRIDIGPTPAPVQRLNVDTQAVNAAFGDGHTDREGVWLNGNYLGYNMTYSDPLQANPYPPKSVEIPPLNAGQSVTIPVPFQKNEFDPATYRYSSRVNSIQAGGFDLSKIPSDTWGADFKHLTDSGTQVTIHAQAMCQDSNQPNGQFTSPCGDGTVQVVVP